MFKSKPSTDLKKIRSELDKGDKLKKDVKKILVKKTNK
jgi:hypothetical protein